MKQQQTTATERERTGLGPLVLIAHESGQAAAPWRDHLARYGCEVDVVSGGVDCLRWLRERAPDVLVLSDGLLWGGSEGVLAYLREAGSSPPVVLVTGGAGAQADQRPRPPVVRSLGQPVPLATLLGSVLAVAEEASQRKGPAAALLSATFLAARDLDLQQRAERALRATGYPPLRGVEAAVRAGVITLRGHVPTYHLKQLAQAAVLKLPGAGAVHNEIEVSDLSAAPVGAPSRGRVLHR